MPKKRSLEDLKQILKNRYKENDKIERLFFPENPLPLAECYLDLALVEEKVIKAKKTASAADESGASSSVLEIIEEDSVSREYFLHDYERIEHIQKKLAVKAILAECKQPKKRIYIEGAAGAGKSTLSRYIAHEWANDQAPWNQYEWVFYFRLRELSIENYPAQLRELLSIIDGELFQGHGNHLKINEINNLLQALAKKPQKVLWIMDGYDELNPAIANCIWWQDLLHSHYDILMTSRPGAQFSKSELGINLNLAVLGFSDAQIEKYIRNFFNPTYTPAVQIQDANQCLLLLKNNSNLWSLSHTPIQLELLCSSWRELSKNKELSLTELYRVILERLLKRRACSESLVVEELNRKQLKARYANYLTYMEYFAFLGMQTKRIVLTEQEMNAAYNILPPEKHKQVDFYKQLKALGIVKRYNNGQQAEFAHLTFQEFFAARYVASAIKAFSENKPHSLSQQDLLDFVSKTKWDSFYEVMWWFVAGLLGGRQNANDQTLEHYQFHHGDSNTSKELTIPKSHQRLQTLQTFFDLLLQEPREELEVFELPLLVRCLVEAGTPNIMQKEVIQLHFKKWMSFYWNSNDELQRNALQKLWYVLRSNREVVIWIESNLLQLLQDKNKWVRRLAATEVGELGASASEALQLGLLLLLQDENWNVCKEAAEAVGRLESSMSEALQKGLLVLLKDKNNRIRRAAAKAVSALGASASEVLQTGLLPLLQDEDESVRIAAAKAVSALGVSTSEVLQKGLLSLLQDESESVRRAATYAVGALGVSASKEVQTNLLPLLHDKKQSVSNLATSRVDTLGAPASEASTKDLLLLLTDEDLNMCEEVASAVNEFGTAARESFQKGLLPLLQDKDEEVRRAAAYAVGILGASASEELQKNLLLLLKDESEWVRNTATHALGALGESARESLQTGLLPLLQDKNEDVRGSAAFVVGTLGAMVSEVLQENLLLLLKDENEWVRSVVAKAVGTLGAFANELLQKGLFVLLQDDNWGVRRVAAEAVSALGASASGELRKSLLLLLQDENKYVRLAAVLAAINTFGSSASEKLQKKLLSLLQDENLYVRRRATQALGVVGASANEELQKELLQLLQDGDEFMRRPAMEAVGQLGASASKDLQTSLLSLLKNDNYLAAELVLQLSVSANEVLQKGLLSLLQNMNKWVRDTAQRALAKTKPGLILLCQEIFKEHPLSIPPSRLIVSSTDVVKVDKRGQLDCLKLCGVVLQNIFQSHGSHNLTEMNWTLAIIRKNLGEAASSSNQANSSSQFFKSLKNLISHAFLILEGVKDGVRFATKIDLYAVGRSGSQSSGQKAEIKITKIDNFVRLQELANNSCSMVHGISRERAEQLLEIIKQDQASAERGAIVYSLTGDGNSSTFNQKPKHSCISWCLEKWQQAGLPLKRKWYDTAIIIPAAYLEEAKQSAEENKCWML